MEEIIKLIEGRINQFEIEKRNEAWDTTKLYLQGNIQGLKQALEIIKGEK